jgi:lipopolysaccharide biosynthesis glycosyltransferase
MKHITIAVDKNYMIPATVMLHSLLCNNNPKDIHIHIILNFKAWLYKLPLRYILNKHHCQYTFHLLEEKDIPFIKDLVISHHISVAAYFRLFLPSILKNVQKTLYLDGDLIVDESIEELYNTILDDESLAAVFYENKERIEALTLKNGYFNSGVILINLNYLRENNCESKFVQFIQNHPEKILFWDQDVLNYTLQDTIAPLHRKWNFIPYNNNYPPEYKPIIIHYAGRHKPWSKYCEKHILNDKYFEYLYKDIGLLILKRIFDAITYVKIKLKKLHF